MFCPNCGKENVNQAKHCAYCGSQLPTSPSAAASDFLAGISAGFGKLKERTEKTVKKASADAKKTISANKENMAKKRKENKVKRQQKSEKAKAAANRFFKKLGIAVAIAVPVLLVLAIGLNVLLANVSLNRLEKYIENGEVSSLAVVSMDRDRLMYEEYAALLNGELDTPEYKQQQELLSAIYKRTDIECGFVFPFLFSSEVEVTVTSIDMASVFSEMMDYIDEDTTDEEFSAKMFELINTSDATICTTMTLPMKLTTKGWLVDTENSEFQNAITGGLHTAYGNLYRESLDEYVAAIQDYEEYVENLPTDNSGEQFVSGTDVD